MSPTPASGYSETSMLVPGTAQDVTIGASGRSGWNMVLRSQVTAGATSPASGYSSWSFALGEPTLERDPIPAGPERWETPRYRFVS